ncbi:MAG: hypothetical protein G8345_02350 [Magnetococcales bacterium]|nr:hypothetical protein [Magnetococcales bacterium]NGZ25711.1 hypothetical protein [Magnetococcales bacterium]
MDTHRPSRPISLVTTPYLSTTAHMPVVDNSEVSHLTGDPLYRRPLGNLCDKEKEIRHASPTEQCRRLGKNTLSFFLNLFQRMGHH